MKKLKLAPSILAADFGNLNRDINKIYEGGADYVHIDVMDGNFVPNISIGIPVVNSIRKKSNMTFDVHLMIDNPEKYIESFSKAGSDIINFHIEATKNPSKIIDTINALGKKSAITVKPNTNIKEVFPLLDNISMVLIMTVEPGFGGQSFMSNQLEKIKILKNEIDKRKLNVDIEVDGGITLNNVRSVIEAGANIIVAGSSVFNAENVQDRVGEFYKIFEEYEGK